MTWLVLIRHGHTAANGSATGMRLSGWTDTPLSDEGRLEVARLARSLRDHPPFAALYTSPLQRARHTALAVQAAIGVAPVVDPGLREIHCGEVDGRSVAHVRLHHAAAWARNSEESDEEFRWPGGESYREFRARCLRAVHAIAARHRGETVAVVTHAGFVSQVLGWMAGITCARWSAFRPGNASMSTIEWSPPRRALVAFGVDAPIAPDARGHARSPPRAG